jgi:hypothetical protein
MTKLLKRSHHSSNTAPGLPLPSSFLRHFEHRKKSIDTLTIQFIVCESNLSKAAHLVEELKLVEACNNSKRKSARRADVEGIQ